LFHHTQPFVEFLLFAFHPCNLGTSAHVNPSKNSPWFLTSFAMFVRALSILFSLALVTSCSTLRGVASKVPLPPLPDVTAVKRLMPGSIDKVSDQDPDISFDPRGTLTHGHTLRLHVSDGLRSARTLWKGIAMVEQDGTLSLGKKVTTRVGGRTLSQASAAIASAFRLSGRTSSPVIVQVISVENQPLVAIEGDTAAGTQYIPRYDQITFRDAVRLAGGRAPGSTARSLYLTRNGLRRYLRSIEEADQQWQLEPGDIITLSSHL